MRFDGYLSASLRLDEEDIISLLILLEGDDFPDRSIHPPTSRVIRDEHDLDSEFERELVFSRELFLIDRSHDRSREGPHATGETLKSLTIHAFSRCIGRRERDHHTLRVIWGDTASIQVLDILRLW